MIFYKIFRRICEKVFDSKIEGWEDLGDIVSWDTLKYCNELVFSDCLAQLPYIAKTRKIPGTFSPKDIRYFFKNLNTGRMSEEFARAWVVFWQSKGICSQEWLVSDRKGRPKTVTICLSGKGYGLCDFEFKGYYPTIYDALKDSLDAERIEVQLYRKWGTR